MKSILTLILCNVVMFEMVNKWRKLYSLVYGPGENIDFRVLPWGVLDRLPGLT